ncbi:unnamed protein product [Chrysoparadoxa australica]
MSLLDICPCCSRLVEKWRQGRQEAGEREMLKRGAPFSKQKVGLFSSGYELVTVKLSEESEAVLQWRRGEGIDNQEDQNQGWKEVELCDVKIVEPRGKSGLCLVSRSGELILDLDTQDVGTDRDAWVIALQRLAEQIRQNPQVARKSIKNRLQDKAMKQAKFAKRSLELVEKKRDAEQRKARYMRETGGMKYTALAMANQER